MIKIDITELNKRLGNKHEAYADASKLYYLPDFTSKAINVEFLKQIFYLDESNPSIFAIPREKLILHDLPPLRVELSVMRLLEKLEDILDELEMPSTGMSISSLPNEEWILRAIMFVDPDNKFQVFGKKIPLEATIYREINPK
jgi:hypothetical protein